MKWLDDSAKIVPVTQRFTEEKKIVGARMDHALLLSIDIKTSSKFIETPTSAGKFTDKAFR